MVPRPRRPAVPALACPILLLTLAACGDTTEERAAGGGLRGAAVGAVTGGPVGALLGAAVGAATDPLIGRALDRATGGDDPPARTTPP